MELLLRELSSNALVFFLLARMQASSILAACPRAPWIVIIPK